MVTGVNFVYLRDLLVLEDFLRVPFVFLSEGQRLRLTLNLAATQTCKYSHFDQNQE
jgi:hypothetical protein